MKRFVKQILVLALFAAVLAGMQSRARSDLMKTEIEPALELESWMMDEFFWSRGAMDWTPAVDQTLALEAWMVDDNYWQ